MITLKQALQDCSTALQSHYGDREAYAISHMLIEHLTQFSKLDVLVHANDMLSEQQMQNYHAALERLQQQEPIQYVLGYAWFMNKQLAVNNAVLIPRPETEELIALIKKHHTSNESLAILEIGTGSGCIAIALKDHFKQAEIWAIDISEQALVVAQQNAKTHDCDIHFNHMDFLDPAHQAILPKFDIIVSNPPYIPIQEKQTMDQHVIQHEPDSALFVPDDVPLLFYKAIAQYALQQSHGPIALYCELHQDYALQTKELFEQLGCTSVRIYKDLYENWRMLSAIKK